MADLTVAKDFFLEYLPENFRKRIDIESLRQEKDSLPNETLNDAYVDILYSAKLDGKPAYFWLILVEQQTKQELLMPLRIQKYLLRICDEHVKKHPGSKLPIIFPMLVYTGKDKYTQPLSFWELFSEPSLAQSYFTGPVTLIELPSLSYEKLRMRKYAGFLLSFMKAIHEADILDVLKDPEQKKLIGEISEENPVFVERALWYILVKGESLSKEEVFQAFENAVSPEERIRIMTIAEELRKEGMEIGLMQGKHEGLQEGLQKGRQEGRQEEKRLIAQKFLSQGIDIHLVSQATGLSEEELQKLSQSPNTPSS